MSHKTNKNTILSIFLLTISCSNFCYADTININPLVSAINNVRQAVLDSAADMQAFMSGMENSRIQRESDLFRQYTQGRAPGDENDEVSELSNSIKGINQETYDVIKTKEILDINYGLYLTPKYENDFITANPMTTITSKHKQLYCSPNSGVEAKLWSGICKEDNSVENQHADIKLSPLINPTKYTEEQSGLADEILRNILSPLPNTDIMTVLNGDKGMVGNTSKEIFSLALLSQAMLAPARESLNNSYAIRYTSKMENMEKESKRRIESSEWLDKVNEASRTSLLREIVHMGAYNMWMQQELYKQQERIELMLAAQQSYTILRDGRLEKKFDELSQGAMGQVQRFQNYSNTGDLDSVVNDALEQVQGNN